MEKEIKSKVLRYIELSKLFSKSSTEIFDENTDPKEGFATIDLSRLVDAENSRMEYRTPNVKLPTRAEKILAQAEVKAKLADDFDEYLSLQEDLEKYFKLNNKLTQ